jgi:hypothetical protein
MSSLRACCQQFIALLAASVAAFEMWLLRRNIGAQMSE